MYMCFHDIRRNDLKIDDRFKQGLMTPEPEEHFAESFPSIKKTQSVHDGLSSRGM